MKLFRNENGNYIVSFQPLIYIQNNGSYPLREFSLKQISAKYFFLCQCTGFIIVIIALGNPFFFKLV